MKIRTDFVTNSSSSSYVVTLTIFTSDGRAIKYRPSGETWSENVGHLLNEFGHYFFGEYKGSIQQLKTAKSIDDLCSLLDRHTTDIVKELERAGVYYDPEEGFSYDACLEIEDEEPDEFEEALAAIIAEYNQDNKQTYGKLTYENMRKHIRGKETPKRADVMLKELNAVIDMSQSRRASYAYVKKWFLSVYKVLLHFGVSMLILEDNLFGSCRLQFPNLAVDVLLILIRAAARISVYHCSISFAHGKIATNVLLAGNFSIKEKHQ